MLMPIPIDSLEQLWELLPVTDVPGDNSSLVFVADIVSKARVRRKLPASADMERLERKAAIARRLFEAYDSNWRPSKETGLTSGEVAVGVAILFLLDAKTSTTKGLALKRLNALFWLADSKQWPSTNDANRVLATACSALAQITETNR